MNRRIPRQTCRDQRDPVWPQLLPAVRISLCPSSPYL